MNRKKEGSENIGEEREKARTIDCKAAEEPVKIMIESLTGYAG